MLAWMLLSTALGFVLAVAAMLVEPVTWRVRIPTRWLWLSVVVATVGWSAAVAVRGPIPGARPELAPLDAPGRLPSSISPAPAPTAREVPATGSDVGLDVLLMALWFAGSVACFAILGFSAWRIARMRRDWRERMLAGVPVMMSHDVGPAVVGVVHHCIVVPEWVAALDEPAQRLVMTHEREHVHAGDPLLLWGTTLLVALMPWNPALWLALRRLRHAIEIDCDARVLQVAPVPDAYCSLLLDVGERTLAGVAPIAALAEPTTLLERRVEAMLTKRMFGVRSTASVLVATSLVVAACRAPHPEVSPRASVAQVARELTSLLATENGRAALPAPDRARLVASLGNGANPADSDTAQYGVRTDSIGRARFPEAYRPHEDAFIVAALYSKDGKLVSSTAKRVPVADAFDVTHWGGKEQLSSRDARRLLELAFNRELPAIKEAGSQWVWTESRTVVAFAVLLE